MTTFQTKQKAHAFTGATALITAAVFTLAAMAFTAKPNDGFKVKGWALDGNAINSSNQVKYDKTYWTRNLPKMR